jgi:hypothetical protein
MNIGVDPPRHSPLTCAGEAMAGRRILDDLTAGRGLFLSIPPAIPATLADSGE